MGRALNPRGRNALARGTVIQARTRMIDQFEMMLQEDQQALRDWESEALRARSNGQDITEEIRAVLRNRIAEMRLLVIKARALDVAP